ncbi:hypothetical protein TARUN_5090 [Trichoderma arundinaceum]|uniref:Uncharacterized protein n=1 Tax=Trichoderma arundinaceum TaxID=490622 RepID=A0A395NMB4_TRIAR|nr:hypothetical protein TARUN_5090 [Trichoderma arundinaceum]
MAMQNRNEDGEIFAVQDAATIAPSSVPCTLPSAFSSQRVHEFWREAVQNEGCQKVAPVRLVRWADGGISGGAPGRECGIEYSPPAVPTERCRGTQYLDLAF